MAAIAPPLAAWPARRRNSIVRGEVLWRARPTRFGGFSPGFAAEHPLNPISRRYSRKCRSASLPWVTATKDLERIFDPFFATKEVGSGTGLGRATVYGIIKQTGGFVFAESAGAGARFTILLPCHEGRAATDLTGGGTVLLVEDENPVRLFGARALRSKGYKVVEAHNGEDALELLRDENFDLLITDMIMPNVNGAAVIAAARETRPELPVICISGYTEESIAKEMDNFADLRFLAKPFSPQDLAGMVKDAIDESERAAGPPA